MRLPDGQRQIVAGGLAALAFLILYFGAALVWWLALLLGAAVYGAFLMLIRTRPRLEDIRLAERVSAADVVAAARALGLAAERMERAAAQARDEDSATILHLADGMRRIRASIEDDPEDYRVARRFVNVFLPAMVATVEGYAGLAGSRDPDLQPRLARLSAQIGAFGPVIDRVNRACVEKDLRALEVEAATVLQLMERV